MRLELYEPGRSTCEIRTLDGVYVLPSWALVELSFRCRLSMNRGGLYRYSPHSQFDRDDSIA